MRTGNKSGVESIPLNALLLSLPTVDTYMSQLGEMVKVGINPTKGPPIESIGSIWWQNSINNMGLSSSECEGEAKH